MLLTLATRSFASTICADGQGPLTMLDLPDYAIRQLRLRGLNVFASMLAGWSLEDLDRLRDRADKAGCPCLALVEEAALCYDSGSGAKAQQAAAANRDRIERLAAAANRLGCNALSLRLTAADTDDGFELIVHEMKSIMPIVERFELNLLISPAPGITAAPDRLTDLIKRIGGFRIGLLPSFAYAAEFKNAAEVLRKLAPYSGAIHASVRGFAKGGKHIGYDLTEFVAAVKSVGFSNPLAIEYLGTGTAEQAAEAIERACDILSAAIADPPTEADVEIEDLATSDAEED